MRKNTFGFSCLFFVVCIGLPSFSFAQTKSEKHALGRHISVDSQAQIDVLPDVVYLTMRIAIRKSTPKGAASEVQSKKKSLVKAFLATKFPAKRLTVSFLNLRPRYTFSRNQLPQAKYYEAAITLVACIHDFKKLGKYMELAATYGAVGLSTRFHNTHFVKHRKTLRLMALKAAKEKALEMTKATNTKLGEVYSISETSSRHSRWSSSSVSNAYVNRSRTSSGNSVKPGGISLKLTVRVVFSLL